MYRADLSKSPPFEQILRDAGWSTSDVERSIGMAGLSEAELEAMLQEVHAATERARKATVDATVLRRRAEAKVIDEAIRSAIGDEQNGPGARLFLFRR